MSLLSVGHEYAGAWLLACPVCRNAHDSLEIYDPVSLCTEECVSVYVSGRGVCVCICMLVEICLSAAAVSLGEHTQDIVGCNTLFII